MLKFIQASKQQHASIPSVQINGVCWCNRKIPLSHGRHVIGRYSPGPGREGVPFESHTEYKVIAYLSALPGVCVVLSQPFTIDYRVHGARRRYTPDLLIVADPLPRELVRNGFGILTVLEVKAVVDPPSRSLVEFKVQLSTHATGLPTLIAIPTLENSGELSHAH
jgi:hypothetical protein